MPEYIPDEEDDSGIIIHALSLAVIFLSFAIGLHFLFDGISIWIGRAL